MRNGSLEVWFSSQHLVRVNQSAIDILKYHLTISISGYELRSTLLLLREEARGRQ